MLPSLSPEMMGVAAALLVLWMLITSAMLRRRVRQGLQQILEELKADADKTTAQVKEITDQVGDLLEAWARSIAICESCGKLLFTTSKAKSIQRGQVTSFYCQDCKDEE